MSLSIRPRNEVVYNGTLNHVYALDAVGTVTARLNAIPLAFFNPAIPEHRVGHITDKKG